LALLSSWAILFCFEICSNAISDRDISRLGAGSQTLLQHTLLLNVFHGLTPAQWMERRGFHEFPYRIRVSPGILPQRPANGFVDEEFF
jgi:hypothetical protein